MNPCISMWQDDEGRTGPFLDEVRKWDNQQRQVYVEEIKSKLGDTKYGLVLCLHNDSHIFLYLNANPTVA